MGGKRSRAAVALGAAIAMGVSGCSSSGRAQGKVAATPTLQVLAGTGRQTPPPWDAPANAVRFIQAAGLPPLESEGHLLHYHAHLDVLVDGRPVTVPRFIGIDEQARRISPLHSHTPDGILHIEAPSQETFTLGQFFTEWDVRLTSECLGSLCAGNGKSLRLYVNGKLRPGDPRPLVLVAHQEITLVYGDAGATPKVPSSYDFPSGL